MLHLVGIFYKLFILFQTAHLEGIRAAAIGRVEVEMSQLVQRLNDVYRLIRESLVSTEHIIHFDGFRTVTIHSA